MRVAYPYRLFCRSLKKIFAFCRTRSLSSEEESQNHQSQNLKANPPQADKMIPDQYQCIYHTSLETAKFAFATCN